MATSTADAVTSPQTHGLLLRATLLITSTLTVMAGATIAPALPAMQAFFRDAPNVEILVPLVLTLPALFIVIGAPIAGFIVDRYGRKPLLVAAVLLYGLAGGSGLLINELSFLLVSRAFLGIAVACIMTSVITLIADYFIGEARARFLGYQAAFTGMGGVAFLSLGGILADIDWHAPFLIYLMAFAVFPLIVFVVYEPQRRKPIVKTDGVSAATTDEVTPVRLMVLIYGTMVISQVVFYLIPVRLPFYLQGLVGANAAQAGFAVAGLSFCYATASSTFGWVNRRLSHMSALAAGFTLTGTGFVLITLAQNWLLLLPALALSGFGLGWVVPNLSVWLANSVPEALRGRALGGLTTSLFLGQFLSPIVLQPLLSVTGDNGIYAALGSLVLALAATFVVGRKLITDFIKV